MIALRIIRCLIINYAMLNSVIAKVTNIDVVIDALGIIFKPLSKDKKKKTCGIPEVGAEKSNSVFHSPMRSPFLCARLPKLQSISVRPSDSF